MTKELNVVDELLGSFSEMLNTCFHLFGFDPCVILSARWNYPVFIIYVIMT